MNPIDFILGLSADYLALKRKVRAMSNDFTELQGTVDSLKTKVAETVGTLKGLAQRIANLENGAPDQAKIDALVADAKQVLGDLSDAEDAADDSLPAA